MADLATLQSWLTDAEAARQKLMTGASESHVQHGDIRVTYTGANIGELNSYITSLQAQIVALGGTITGTGVRRRAIVVDL